MLSDGTAWNSVSLTSTRLPPTHKVTDKLKLLTSLFVNELKWRLDDSKGKWTNELPSALWAFRTTSRRLTGEASFPMTYGAEAMIPLEMGLPTSQTNQLEVEENNHLLRRHLDLIEEICEVASVKLANYRQRISHGRFGIKEVLGKHLESFLGETRSQLQGAIPGNICHGDRGLLVRRFG